MDQTGRGLQLEAPVSSFYLWQAVAHIPGSFIYYDDELLTFQVTGPQVDLVIAVMTPLLAVAVLAVAGLGAYKAWRGASFAALFPALALGLVLAFILFNKVGSPQYMSWLAAPFIVALVIDRHRWFKPATLGLAIALLTFIVYPLTYWGILIALPFPAGLLTARNVLLAVLFVWVVIRLGRVQIHPHVHARNLARRSRAAVH